MAMTGTASPNNATVDVVMDPGNPDLVICTVADALGNGDGGIFRSTGCHCRSPNFHANVCHEPGQQQFSNRTGTASDPAAVS